MITHWCVSNFKSVRDRKELSFAPLTILAGLNSSGKSSLVQSILLFAQTLRSPTKEQPVVLNGSLACLGQFNELTNRSGETDEITVGCTCSPGLDATGSRANTASRDEGLKSGRMAGERLTNISCEISFYADASSPEGEMQQMQPRLLSSEINCKVKDQDNQERVTEFTAYSLSIVRWFLSIFTNVKKDSQSTDHEVRYAANLDDQSAGEIRSRIAGTAGFGCTLDHFLPQSIFGIVDNMREEAEDIGFALRTFTIRPNRKRTFATKPLVLTIEVEQVMRSALGGSINYDHIFGGLRLIEHNSEVDGRTAASGNRGIPLEDWIEFAANMPERQQVEIQAAFQECEGLITQIYNAIKKGRPDESRKGTLVSTRLPRSLGTGTRYLQTFFNSFFTYLGPLREGPKPIYSPPSEMRRNDVGTSGEHTAFLLDLHRNTRVRYLPSSNFATPEVERRIAVRTLSKAMRDWLGYLDVAAEVESRSRGKLGHELKVGFTNSTESYDVVHVGVGVSQLLPIVLACLLAKEGATLVFEQPELHLHPRVQSMLGDFFLSMALCGKQCIVETHSEHIVDRLRYRIAAAQRSSKRNSVVGEMQDMTKVYFVEKIDGASEFREVAINRYGAIDDWPKGFFDQSYRQAEEIIRLAAIKRRSEKESE